ncbi:hypothetical protein QL285_077686 [Trifolium repens]|nr:hypothetical protein QL285_077686 [Trifolium repens]
MNSFRIRKQRMGVSAYGESRSATVFAHVGVGTTLNPLGKYGSWASFKKYPIISGGQYMKESFPEVFPTLPLTSDKIEEETIYQKSQMEKDFLAIRHSDLIIYLVLGGLFFYTLYAGYFGWQCRRVRTIQNDINELKKQVKPVPITPDVNSVESSPPSPLELQIQQLTEVCSSRLAVVPFMHYYCMLHRM